MTSAAVFRRFPNLSFQPGKSFIWSPHKGVVFYDSDRIESNEGMMALLHEIGHAQLGHETFEYDIELLNMEVEAWTKARSLAKRINFELDEGHIDDCLETYRLWLYKRSKCPVCANTSLQENVTTYRCFVCNSSWRVAQTRTVQPRRMRCISP